MPSNRNIRIALGVLVVVSALARGFIAGFIELGNDEVYYWTYAKFPAMSHFDHPPMVGLAIQAFTLNLTYESELFIRLASVILGTICTILIFLIGQTIKNPLTGLYAAFLYTASCMHCMPVSLGQGGAGLGTMWGWETAEAMLKEAGFARPERTTFEHDPLNVWFVSRKA